MKPHAGSLRALSPLALFLCLYLGASLAAGDFYKVPVTVAFLFACLWAVAVTRRLGLTQRIDEFCRGAANPGILIMVCIFILAGAFARSAGAMGAIDATVNLMMRLIPARFLPAGIFLATCFISLSIGTSVGTIVALTPVAAGLAGQAGLPLPMMVAVVVGGSFFGDNLSFISDTTIAATRTQGCEMRDKFRVNSLIVVPAALLAIGLYLFTSAPAVSVAAPGPVEWVKVVPYLAVLGLAVAGVNVLAVLSTGVLLTGVLGMCSGSLGLFEWFGALGDGIAGMGELIVVTLLAGGMLRLIEYNGGIDYLIDRLTRRISGRRGAELSIAALVSVANLCTANNTIAIITVGPIARRIASRFGVDPRKSASLLDTFSCMVQGLIPYGAQVLMAAGLVGISPIEIIGRLYYPPLMGLCALAAILFRYPRNRVG